jgi:hypothetical protein
VGPEFGRKQEGGPLSEAQKGRLLLVHSILEMVASLQKILLADVNTDIYYKEEYQTE